MPSFENCQTEAGVPAIAMGDRTGAWALACVVVEVTVKGRPARARAEVVASWIWFESCGIA